MQKVLVYSGLLVAGLVLSQLVPGWLGKDAADAWGTGVRWLTMIALAFIMIHVGLEFDIDKSNLRKYGWDYVVACTAAAFPWIFAAVYFVFVFHPPDQWWVSHTWTESLLTGRFAAPTSAGVLFSMLAAAGLVSTWLFVKARILAIFDDIDTVLFMIPLKMMMVGLKWQLGVVVLLMLAQLWLAWKYLHRWNLPSRWYHVLGYAFVLFAACELIYQGSKAVDSSVPVHLEVLLPAFVLGCMIRSRHGHGLAQAEGATPEHHGAHHAKVDAHARSEALAGTVISGTFMVLVGLSMPSISGMVAPGESIDWGIIAFHVLIVTVLSNLGKMFPAFCYRREATRRERIAVAIGMWPRGEVGAGVLVVSLSYGIGGPMVIVAMLSLALNLLLTGVFIVIVKRLIGPNPTPAPAVA